jgi:ABC-type nitrate/sulfonate/bicarbonate transport system permease component
MVNLTGPRMRSMASGLGGLVVVGGLWEVLARLGVLGASWPPLSRVAGTMFDQRDVLLSQLLITVGRAAAGYCIGLACAVGLAAVATIERRIRAVADNLATTLNAIPVIALGPALVTLISRGDTPITIAALGVFFTSFVTVSAGFSAVTAAHGDVFAVLGAGRRKRFIMLELPTSVPALFDALALAAPAAILGAIIGEWFGAPDGIGPLLVSAMQNVQIDLLWAGAVSSAIVSIVIYGLLALLRSIAQKRFT